MSGLRAGKISFAESERGTTTSLQWLDCPSHQPRDEAEAEGDVGPTLVARHVILERIHRPNEGVRAARRGHSLVRMPHAFAVAVVEKSIEEFAPIVLLPQKTYARHQLQP